MLQKLRNSKHSLTLIKPNEEIILLNNTFFKNPDKFLEMKKILEKGTGKRSDKDLYFLATYLKYNVFFLNLVQTKDYSTLEQCFRNMQIEYHPKFTFIFQFGQKGEKFYIILKGEAQLMLPKDNSFNDKENIVENMIKIKLLNVGNSFGELALFSNKTRTASIYTTQDCYLAVLSKKDFKKILWRFEERKMVNSLNFLLDFYIFKGWSFTELKEIFPKFFEKKFERKTIIFRKGENADFIYFIKNGEFKLTFQEKRKEIESNYDLKNSFAPKLKTHFKFHEIALYGKNSMLGEEDAIILGHHQFNLECIEPGSILTLHKNVLAFWEANEKKRQILKEITNVAHQKLLHYKERMQEIIKREKEIYQNYELKKKLPRIITGLKPNSQRKTFFLKGGCHESRSRIVALSTRLSFSLNIKIHDIDHVLSNSKIINTERSSLNEDSLSSVIGKLKKRKDNEIKNLKKIPSSDRNSNNQISKSNYLEKILKKKRYKLIDEREKLLDFETMKISEIKSFQYIVSKLAPLDYEEMKKKIRIVQNLKMKIK